MYIILILTVVFPVDLVQGGARADPVHLAEQLLLDVL